MTLETKPETSFYMDGQGVQVTNARLIVGHTTYAMSNISSVELKKIEPNKSGPQALILFSVLLLCASFMRPGLGPLLLAALAFIGVGIWWMTSLKPTYSVGVQSSSGKFSPIVSRERERIDKIVQAVNEAMISRG